MDKQIHQPRNRTALMQHLQRLVTTGHHFWCADQIPYQRLVPFIDKWQPELALRADAPARAYRKQCGKASVHLCLDTGLSKDSEAIMAWWMLSTEGKHGLTTQTHPPATVNDCRTEAGRLRLGDYELLNLQRHPPPPAKATTTWTWRLTPQRYRAWEAWIVERAKARDIDGLKLILASLTSMPMFSGIRDQVSKLLREMNKMMGKMGLAPLLTPTLPMMRMLKLWGDEVGF